MARIWSEQDKIDFVKKLKESYIGDYYECKCCGYKWKARYKKKPIHCANKSCYAIIWEIGYNQLCFACERNVLIPILHHVNGNQKDNTDENRVLVCQDCHTAIHQGFGNHKSRRSRSRRYDFCGQLVLQRLKMLREVWLKNKRLLAKPKSSCESTETFK